MLPVSGASLKYPSQHTRSLDNVIERGEGCTVGLEKVGGGNVKLKMYLRYYGNICDILTGGGGVNIIRFFF